MKTFEQWWNNYDFAPDVKDVCFDESRFNNSEGKEQSFYWNDICEWARQACKDSRQEVADQYEHKIKNIEQSSSMKIAILERQLSDALKDLKLATDEAEMKANCRYTTKRMEEIRQRHKLDEVTRFDAEPTRVIFSEEDK